MVWLNYEKFGWRLIQDPGNCNNVHEFIRKAYEPTLFGCNPGC